MSSDGNAAGAAPAMPAGNRRSPAGAAAGLVRALRVSNVPAAIVDAIQSRDYPVIQAMILVTGAIFAVITVVVDIAMRVLDPRTARNS